MNKQMNIDLRFNADVSAVKANLESLRSSLSSISNMPIPLGTQLSSGMAQASQSAQQLKLHLASAFDVKTGNLNLNALNSSLKASGQSLSTLTSGLLNAGVQGEQAFMNVQSAIANAGVQINQAHGLLGSFLITLKNTAKWQLSSMLLHGFINGIRSAFTYSQDLDKSLNNIRIVTGYSSDEMSKFAEEANRAAKALNTTTVKYTDASLIFYQQGLSKEEVAERADVAIRLANVSRQSTEVVADQMTAIWNNFYDGSQSLEYYADVLTALGATTASSSAEIAGGLEKFAAIGNTVGLSYEYAAAALATITANTRQSEEVVGTALKTIFARIQGLKLGETLEDGTDLNKYSEALKTVGIDIKDGFDQLKDMDVILEEMGAKWKTLSEAQQVAVAQAVGGIRQYNQIIALMDNWDAGDADSFVNALETAKNATGELDDQAERYAESWEAAKSRVTRATEQLYNNLIPREGMVDMTNIFASLIEGISDVVEGFGGISQIILMVTSIMINKMGPAMIAGFDNGILKVQEFGSHIMGLPARIGTFFKSFLHGNEQLVQTNEQIKQVANGASNAGQQIKFFNDNLKNGANNTLLQQQQSIAKAVDGTRILTDTFREHLGDVAQVNNIQGLINANSNKLTSSTKAQLSSYQQQLLMLAEKKAQEAETLEIIEQQKQSLIDRNQFDYTNPRYTETFNAQGDVTSTSLETTVIQSETLANKWVEILNTMYKTKTEVDAINGGIVYSSEGTNGMAMAAQNSLDLYSQIQGKNLEVIDLLNQEVELKNKDNEITQNGTISLDSQKSAIMKIINDLEKQNVITKEQANNMRDTTKELNGQGKSVNELRSFFQSLSSDARRFANSLGNSTDTLNQMDNLLEQGVNAEKKKVQVAEEYKSVLQTTTGLLAKGINNFTQGFGASLQAMASGATTVAMGINSIVNFVELLQDKNATWTSLLISGAMAASMGLSALMITMKALGTAIGVVSSAIGGYNIVSNISLLGTLAIKGASEEATKAEIKEAFAKKFNKSETESAAAAEAIYTAMKTKGIWAAMKATVAQLGYNAALLPFIAILLAISAIGLVVWALLSKPPETDPLQEELNSLKEESAALGKAFNEAKKAAEDLASGFSAYDEVAKKLSTCKKGTDEWRNAIQQTNDQVQELIKKFPELATMPGAIAIGEHGELVITEQGRKQATELYNQRMANAQTASAIADQQVREQEIKILDKKRHYDKYLTTGGTWVEMPSNLNNGDALEKQVYDYAVQKYNTRDLTEEQIAAVIHEMQNDLKLLPQNADLAELKKKAVGLVQVENDLIRAIQENTVATQATNTGLASNLLSNNTEYQQSNYQGNIAFVTGQLGFGNAQEVKDSQGNTYTTTEEATAAEQVKNSYLNVLNDADSGHHKDKEKTENFIRDYKQITGFDETKVSDYRITDVGIEYYTLDEQGNKSSEPVKISNEEIAATLAARDINQATEATGNIMTTQMNKFNTQEEADIFTTAVTQDAAFLSPELLKKSEAEINKIIDSMEITDDVVKQIGFDLDKNGKITEDETKAFKAYQKEVVNSKKNFTIFKQNGVAALQIIGNEASSVFSDTGRKIGEWSDEAEEAAKIISTDLSNALGLSTDLGLDPDFIRENQQLIDDFMNNVEGSGAKLKAALQEDAIIDVTANVQDEEMKAKLQNLHNNLILFENEDWQVGVEIDPTKEADFYAACQNMIDAAGMTAEQAQKYFGKMGYDVKFKNEPKKVTEIVWNKKYNNIYDEEGNLLESKVDATPQVIEGEVQVPVIETITPNSSFGGHIDSINDGGYTGSGTFKPTTTDTGKGGGGGEKKDKHFKEKDKKQEKKYEDEFDRYRDITTALEAYNSELEETQALKDELWGGNKLQAMEAEKKKLGEITNKQKEYLKAISGSETGKFEDGYLKQDLDALKVQEADAVFDENGNLLNYHEITQKWLNELNTAQNIYNAEMERITQEYNDNKKSENAENIYNDAKTELDDALEEAERLYENRKAALDKWEETYDLNEKQKQQLEDYFRQLRELNYEALEYKIEIQVELNENDIADVEFRLNRLGEDNIYNSAERIAEIEKNATSYKKIADAQIENMREAERLYQLYLDGDKANGISQENYMARIKDGKEAIQDAENSIREGIQQIGEELQNTFDMADEKIEQQYTKFERITELIDHYKNVVSLTEGEASYKKFNQLLRTQQEVLKDRITATKAEITMWENQEAQMKAAMVGMDKNSPEYLAAEQALDNIIEKQNEAKSQLMADIEQLGEYAREIFENSIEQAVIDFEKAMFGRSLNTVIESIEMLNAKQEELLTTTNKIYETNKMLRNIEKDIEATTNNRAKQALAEFQNKVKQKQEQNELTQFELDLLTAEYEITKAQIALEEAQNAKNQVRLTRDSEGNYGYVYTANQDKISEAEQALDDATNNYYNTALEGAEKYQDQIYSHIQEWEEKVKEVYLDQTLSEEEKNRKIREINDTYNTLITQDKNLYYMAIGAVQESAYNTQVDYDLRGIASAEKWFVECDGFLSDMKLAQNELDRNTGEVAQNTTENFGNMSTSIKNATTDSNNLQFATKNLTNQLNNEMIGAIQNAKGAWEEYAGKLREVIGLANEAMGITNTAMGKPSDEDGVISDYSQEIYNKIKSGNYTEEELQELIDARWEKMGGIDNYNYIDMMKNTDDPIWDQVYKMLRDYKISHTDWMAEIQKAIDAGQKLEDIQWMIELRDRKLYEMGKPLTSLEDAKKYAESIGATLASGGYTGEWGPEGKLAVLHQKELVLNAQDTENFLGGIAILREISQMLDHNALMASLGAINLHAMTIGTPADQILQQEVTIHADFPNVTDHNEIEIAIDNLINAASQHAYKM